MDRNQRNMRRQAPRHEAGQDEQVDDLGPRVMDLTAEQLMRFMNERFPVQQQPQNTDRFALSPALVGTGQPLDYGSAAGAKIYKSSTAPLPVTFDMEPESIFTFNDVLRDRCVSAAWNTPQADIITIPVEGRNLDLIESYGEIALHQVRGHCATYVGQQSRKSQHSYQMYECLVNSLTDSARVKLAPDSDQYTINGVRCGPLLYRYMMAKASVDTRATLSFIRENLSNLDTYIATVGSNITIFNEYVKRQRLSLKARGGVTHDLLTNLWKAYQNVSDRDFVEFIKRKKDAYDEGEDFTPDSLMIAAENKYRTLIQEERWNSLSPEQSQIVALTAQLSKLKDSRVSIGKGNMNRKIGNRKEKGRFIKKDHRSENKKTDNKKRTRRKGKDDLKWAWKKVPPKDGEKEEKIFNGTTYYWCHHHGLWTLTKHTDETCYLKKKENRNKQNISEESILPKANNAQSSQTQNNQLVAFATKLQQVMEE